MGGIGSIFKNVAGFALPVAGGAVGGPLGAMAGSALSGGIDKALSPTPQDQQNAIQPIQSGGTNQLLQALMSRYQGSK